MLVVLTTICFCCVLQGVKELYFWYDAASESVTIKKPDVRLVEDWDITIVA